MSIYTELDHGLSETQIKCIAKQMFEVKLASVIYSYRISYGRLSDSCTVLNAFIEILRQGIYYYVQMEPFD